MLIIEKDSRFLFVKRNPGGSAGGYWCPVSGGIEPGEAQAETVVREAREEVGLEVRAGVKVGERPCSTGEYLLHWWTAEILSGVAHVAAPEEIEEVRWVDLKDVRELQPHFKEDVDFILSMALG